MQTDDHSQQILARLSELSRFLGRPELDLVILGEGNTSAAVGDGTFWVKPSGTELATIEARRFVRVDLERALSVLEDPARTQEEVTKRVQDAVVGNTQERPSMEALMHAVCLSLGKASFVAHTHPTAVNVVTCSQLFWELFQERIFPDEVVVCGRHPLLLPYKAPGFPLALLLEAKMLEYIDEHGGPPRWVLLQNHGMIALGRSADEVRAITLMAVKTARILAGANTLDGVRFLGSEEADDLDRRPDEKYRQSRIRNPT